MAKRRTIGDNPLDSVVPGGGEGAVLGREGPKKKDPARGGAREKSKTPPTGQPAPVRVESSARAHRTASAAHGAEAVVAPAAQPEELLPRLEKLEQENECLKWLVGAVLAPLALLAILL
jgi:hypothetical protein